MNLIILLLAIVFAVLSCVIIVRVNTDTDTKPWIATTVSLILVTLIISVLYVAENEPEEVLTANTEIAAMHNAE